MSGDRINSTLKNSIVLAMSHDLPPHCLNSAQQVSRPNALADFPRHNVKAADHACLLEVAVGDVAFETFGSNEARLDFRGEGSMPQARHTYFVEEQAAH